MRVEVLNRSEIEKRSQIERHEDKVIISIYTPCDPPAKINTENYSIRDILFLSFADCDDTDRQYYTEDWIFSYQQAYLIFEFVQKWKDKIDVLWVQCDGGISRSAGVAGAILKALTNDDSQIFKNKKYYPNMLVYKRTLEIFINELD